MKGRPRYALPESMDVVVDAIGISATLSLVHVYAGTRIYLPKPGNLDEQHPIASLLGLELTRRLCTAVGGDQVVIPVCHKMLAERRADEILRRWEDGESVPELATTYALSERAVYAILATERA